MKTFFEDMAVGQKESFGSYSVTREEVMEFAGRYDPQPFHLDDDAAAASPLFGRLAASGWHTAAMAMRMTVDHWRDIGFASLGGGGMDELTWLKPVYPGDTLRVESEVLETRESRSRKDMGTLKVRTIVLNQADEPVMRQVANLFIQRRPHAG
jgi:acyl dehydratase